MKEDFKNFIKRAKDIKLSETERDILRSKILEFISFNPIRGKTPAIREKNYLSIFEIKYFARAVSLVLIIAVVVGGTGVSYAASNALPGEKLYGVKVNINENLEETFATTSKAKLAVQSEHIQKRLDEAQTLRKENKLSPATEKIVALKINEHTEEAIKSINNLKEEGDVETVLETTSKLTPVLEANRNILAKASKTTNTTLAAENTNSIIAEVDNSIRAVQDQENSVIAVVSDEQEQGDATSTTLALMKTDTSVKSASSTAEKKATNEAREQLKAISDEIDDLVKDRINSAKEKLAAIKAEIKDEESLETSLPEDTSVTENATTTVDALTPSTTTPGLSKNISSQIEQDKTASSTTQPSITSEEVRMTTQSQSDDGFDLDAKIKNAEILLRKAQDLLNSKKYKEALMTAQEVNKAAGEIETYLRMKELNLSKNTQTNENLKASAEASLK